MARNVAQLLLSLLCFSCGARQDNVVTRDGSGVTLRFISLYSPYSVLGLTYFTLYPVVL